MYYNQFAKKMNKNLKYALIGLAVLGGGYLVYRYFFKKDDDEIVHDKMTRNITIENNLNS